MGPKIIHVLALMKFFPAAAAAYHFCLILPATISQPWSYNFSVSNWEWIWLSVLVRFLARILSLPPSTWCDVWDSYSSPYRRGRGVRGLSCQNTPGARYLFIVHILHTYEHISTKMLFRWNNTISQIYRSKEMLILKDKIERWVRRSLVGLACPLIRVAPKKLEGILGFEITLSSDSSSISILTYLALIWEQPNLFSKVILLKELTNILLQQQKHWSGLSPLVVYWMARAQPFFSISQGEGKDRR